MKSVKHMKKILLYILAASTLTMTRCSNFLEVEQLGKSDIPNYLSDIDGIRTAANGIYRTAYDFYDKYFMRYADVASDLVSLTISATDQTLQNLYNFSSMKEDNTGYPRYLWLSGYTILTNANNLLEYLPAAKEKYPQYASELRQYEAEALYFRSLALLDLCLCYGQHYTYTADASHLGVPVLTKTPDFNETILRNTVAQVYSRILQDLPAALAILDETGPTTDTYYYVSGNACRALLARVYLYMENWTEAENYASQLIASVPLTSRDEYVAMFGGGTRDVEIKDTEAIFRLSGYGAGTSLYSFYSLLAQKQMAMPSDDLFSYFDDPNDVRLQLLYEDNGEENEDQTAEMSPACAKYSPDLNVLPDDRNYAPIVSRVSEMYLIRAEARCNKPTPDLDGAADDLKNLISRATGKTKEEIVLTYANQEDMNALILKERVRELCFEGHRLFDLTRHRQGVARHDAEGEVIFEMSYPSDYFVQPICELEMEANRGIQQNPGY